jgi:hypothetical protein
MLLLYALRLEQLGNTLVPAVHLPEPVPATHDSTADEISKGLTTYPHHLTAWLQATVTKLQHDTRHTTHDTLAKASSSTTCYVMLQLSSATVDAAESCNSHNCQTSTSYKEIINSCNGCNMCPYRPECALVQHTKISTVHTTCAA